MILVVDGFNLLYKVGHLEDHMHARRLETAMRGLLEYLHEYRGASRKPPQVHVFFDGKKKQGDDTDAEDVSGMHVYYSKELSADFLIQQFIKTCPSPGEVWVVSSDKAVSDFARRKKCHTQTSEEFAKAMTAAIRAKNDDPVQKTGGAALSAKELAFWADMFKKRKKD
ncbi:MAG: NYN domain-containing protein [Spirochaetia bacterium]|nr:NYN domain-containing protein [Spirochaetia bacterium]